MLTFSVVLNMINSDEENCGKQKRNYAKEWLDIYMVGVITRALRMRLMIFFLLVITRKDEISTLLAL